MVALALLGTGYRQGRLYAPTNTVARDRLIKLIDAAIGAVIAAFSTKASP